MATVGLEHHQMGVGGEWVDADNVKTVHLDLSRPLDGRACDVPPSRSPAREETS
jgi:hypothetical protein